jgi:hypothetical protein
MTECHCMKGTCVECMDRYLRASEEFDRDLQPGGRLDQKMQQIREQVDIIVSRDHQLDVRPHPDGCHTEHCTTTLEVHCTCGWAQGCTTTEQAERLVRGHLTDPSLSVVKAGLSVVKAGPL